MNDPWSDFVAYLRRSSEPHLIASAMSDRARRLKQASYYIRPLQTAQPLVDAMCDSCWESHDQLLGLIAGPLADC
jgi:hypothetical protein